MFGRVLAEWHTDRRPVHGRAFFVELCGVNRSHVQRVVRRELGISPSGLVNELRLHRASLLLRTTDHPIGRIATDCGFQNLSYFHRGFKAHFGLTPRAFRIRHRFSTDPARIIGGPGRAGRR